MPELDFDTIRGLSYYQYAKIIARKAFSLGYAGQQVPKDPIHSTMVALSPGHAIHLRENNRRWDLHDDLGRIVGHLAKSFLRRQDSIARSSQLQLSLSDGWRTPAQAKRRFLSAILGRLWPQSWYSPDDKLFRVMARAV